MPNLSIELTQADYDQLQSDISDSRKDRSEYIRDRLLGGGGTSKGSWAADVPPQVRVLLEERLASVKRDGSLPYDGDEIRKEARKLAGL